MARYASDDQAPFSNGSISFGAYAIDLPAKDRTTDLIDQARVAAESGYDGVTVSEHHAGFPGYLPNPLQVVSWFLEQCDIPWVAACPVLVPLRSAPLLVEDVAWLGARHPGRLGVGLAPGYAAADFELVGRPLKDRFKDFEQKLEVVTAALAGKATGLLANDDAVALCRDVPIPVISTAASRPAVRRAARYGAGILLGAFTTPTRCRELVDEYHDADGKGPCVLIRRGWMGNLPQSVQDQLLQEYRNTRGDTQHLASGSVEELVLGNMGDVRDRIQNAWDASGCTSLSLRVHLPGMAPANIHSQIRMFGELAKQLRTPVDAPNRTSP